MSAILNKSKQISGTPKAQTPKSNKANTNVGNNASKKRWRSQSNATPAAKSPKLEKPGSTKTPNVSNNSAKKRKNKNTESTSRTPKANAKLEMKRTKRLEAKANFNSMLNKCTEGDEDAVKLVLQKIQELEQKPDKSKTALRKLRQLKKRANQQNTVSPTENKRNIPKQTSKVKVQPKDDKSIPRTPKANDRLEMKRTKRLEKKIATKAHFNNMLNKCTEGNEDAVNFVLQKIQELEQKQDKGKSAIQKLKQLKNRVNQHNAVSSTTTEIKKKFPKQTMKMNVQAKDDNGTDDILEFLQCY